MTCVGSVPVGCLLVNLSPWVFKPKAVMREGKTLDHGNIKISYVQSRVFGESYPGRIALTLEIDK